MKRIKPPNVHWHQISAPDSSDRLAAVFDRIFSLVVREWTARSDQPDLDNKRQLAKMTK